MSIVTLLAHASAHPLPLVALLYIGPDVFLPLASALAAIAGVAMMFWQKLIAGLRALWRLLARRRPS